MIYITGDTHGKRSRFQDLSRYGEEKWNDSDFLIICGDFGYLLFNDKKENEYLDELEKKPYTICFIDGNHENFPAIESYPEEKWNGGMIHKIRKNIFHLKRGQVFTLNGKKIFTMGGAYSADRSTRIKNISYWDDEIPSDDDYKEAIRNLELANHQVDYIITHTAPYETILKMGYYPDRHDRELTGFLEWVMYETDFSKWFFGHWHEDRVISEKMIAVFSEVISIPENQS